MLANGPSDGILAGNSKNKGRFPLKTEHQRHTLSSVVRYTEPLSVLTTRAAQRRNSVFGMDADSEVGEHIVEIVVKVVQIVKVIQIVQIIEIKRIIFWIVVG